MTRTDFICAISRYCERAVRSNVKPERVAQLRACLNDFLREVQQDMDDHPDLFEHPGWGRRQVTPPAGLERG